MWYSNLDLLLWSDANVLDSLLGAGTTTNLESLVGKVHLGGKGGVWHPLVGSAWGGLLQHLVDLLEGEALGLWDEEVGKEERSAAEGAPHEEDLGAKVGLSLLSTNEVWSDDSNDTVPEPVGCS